MTKKQVYTAPEAETLVVQAEEGLCYMSPNTAVFTEYLILGSEEDL